MNKPNRKKPAETDLMDMKLVRCPKSRKASAGTARTTANRANGARLSWVSARRTSDRSLSEVTSFETDRYDPEFTGWGRRKIFHTAAPVANRRATAAPGNFALYAALNPSVQYPPSPKLPNRLQYKFAKPIRETITVKGTQTVATCCGPFAAYRIRTGCGGVHVGDFPCAIASQSGPPRFRDGKHQSHERDLP